ncbi:hypothetical protein CCR94_01075 [Rhodoblastus sphagnicola]|uniref:Uncharacterized protein n=1 Tax=Rhodoblastus sphagnicola TaxID=333368 RepID=A0A2S6NG61_9HYPH|nr:hypothetical protein [Rhodoblastus sphagnicola]MBB4200695.1 hypothetical protein [Rhodoblastus sphagnicola]PPQ33632.1 hypothetical protein CCR94_01075 [Rhodoblastus sphagnicola]
MKFQAPPGVTALSCAGEELIPDAQGNFEAAEGHASDLLAHGCVPAPAPCDAEAPRAKNKRKAD